MVSLEEVARHCDTLRSPPGQQARRDRHRRSTYCCCGTPPLLNCCWTHIHVGLYRFALYASRRRLRAWPGGGGAHKWTDIFLSTPLAADFGPGPEAAAEGQAAGRGIFFTCRLPPTFGLARMGRWRGALPSSGVFFSIFHSLALAFRWEDKLSSVNGPNTI